MSHKFTKYIIINTEAPEEIPIKRIKLHHEADISSKSEVITVNTNIVTGETTEEKTPIIKNNEPNRGPIEEPNKPQKKNFRHNERDRLLERLLSRSVTYERNFICQCVKYIVDNNFFD